MTQDFPWACVTDPANRVSLAVVRSLGRAGIPVRLGIPDLAHGGISPGGPACHSRFVRERLALPSPLDAGRFCEALGDATQPGEVILPVSINSLLAALSDRRLRQKRRLPFAPVGAVHNVNSKSWILPRARALGLAVPQTLVPGSLEEALGAAGRLSYPQVLKLRDDEGLFLPPAGRYAVARDPSEFSAHYRRLHQVKPLPLSQEFVDGEGVGASLLYWKGRRVAAFCHRRLREYPRTGGPASLAQSIHDPDLVAAASRLLESVEWEGPAMVEFRRERSTGRSFLMEVNPRFWGTLPLAIACGIDFPLLCYRLALGEAVPPSGRYPAGVRIRFSAMECAGILEEVRRGRWRVALADSRNLAAEGRAADGLWDPSDPAPWRFQWVDAARRIIS